jgi:hypothetical protein
MIEKIKIILKSVGNWSLFTCAIIASFFIGYYYPNLQKSIHHEKEARKFIQPKSLNQVSVSITDRGEMLIINRVNGMYDVYDESVGIEIFKAYGNQITSSQIK